MPEQERAKLANRRFQAYPIDYFHWPDKKICARAGG